MILGHRARVAILATLFALLALMFFTRRANAGWSSDPVEVHATTAHCPLVAACDDGQRGAIVVWQESIATGGSLRARHVTASGDVDPAWAAPALVCDRDAARGSLGAVSDGSGGAYVWWMENRVLFLTRVAPNGQVAPGWSAGGRYLTTFLDARFRPIALSDGSGGIYIGCLSPPPVPPNVWQFHVRVLRLGPGGTAVGGWPAGGRSYGLASGDYPFVVSFGMDRGADGGLWLAWQTVNLLEIVTHDGELRALRITPAGLPSAGWTTAGVHLEPYNAAYVRTLDPLPVPTSHAQVVVASDGADGAYIISSRIEQGLTPELFTCPVILRRLDGSGAPAAGWEDPGIQIDEWFEREGWEPGPKGSLRAISDQRGGAYTGLPSYGSDGPYNVFFDHRDASGGIILGGVWGEIPGLEVVARGDGGMVRSASSPFA